VIEKGRVKELGNHEELMALNGLYAELVALQVIMAVTIEERIGWDDDDDDDDDDGWW
jgi:hypothetical protein